MKLQHIKEHLISRFSLPEKWQGTAFKEIPLLALDFELTSLSHKESDILSAAWIEGMNNHIDFSSRFYQVVACKSDLHQSPTIHGLTAEKIAQGDSLERVLAQLAEKTETHAWVLHNAELDISVLRKKWRQAGILTPKILTIDTMQLRLYTLRKCFPIVPKGSAQLTQCCEDYNLPTFCSHNALDDATATLELLFAQTYELDQSNTLRIEDLMHTGAVRWM